MKLASRKAGDATGNSSSSIARLTDLSPCRRHRANAAVAHSDQWNEVEPLLRDVANALEAGEVAGARPFDPRRMRSTAAPRLSLGRTPARIVNHVELVRKARGAEMPKSFWEDPLIYQGGSDDLLGACDDASFLSEEHGIDLEAEVAVITDDVPLGTPASAMASHVKLLMLVNDWTLRNLVPGELAKGFGFYQSKPATGFSPVAITPDELGAAWREGRSTCRSCPTSTARCSAVRMQGWT